jgi:hypothetical protein
MNTRTFEEVIKELEEEGHLALAELVRAVAADSILCSLIPDCSHLRLLLRVSQPPYSELMVAHESAKKRGGPTVADPNANFEIVVHGEEGPKSTESISGVAATVERLRALVSA